MKQSSKKAALHLRRGPAVSVKLAAGPFLQFKIGISGKK
jgi:hypothetical protein